MVTENTNNLKIYIKPLLWSIEIVNGQGQSYGTPDMTCRKKIAG